MEGCLSLELIRHIDVAGEDYRRMKWDRAQRDAFRVAFKKLFARVSIETFLKCTNYERARRLAALTGGEVIVEGGEALIVCKLRLQRHGTYCAVTWLTGSGKQVALVHVFEERMFQHAKVRLFAIAKALLRVRDIKMGGSRGKNV